VVGSVLAGYEVEALIGRGGMGAVYRAHELGLGRKVALKVIAPELAQDDRFRERFLRESRIAASLDHPHVVPIFTAGEEDSALFLAMRYVEGTDLAKLLRDEGALEPRRAVEILEQVAEALDAAHEKGLVHRDVKPSNVLIARAGGKEHCYLADFGLTKRTGSLSGVSAPGDVVGTLEYVAPEQITGDDVEAAADLYSLGCVLYESLTGQPPFPRATDVALLWAHVHEEPRPASEVRPELPKEIDPVLARALDKDPAGRYATAGELVGDARPALGLVETTPAPASPFSRRLALPAAVALALVAAALAFLLLRDSPGGLSEVSPNFVGVIDPAANDLVAQVQVGIDPEAIASGEGSVWAVNIEDETVSRIHPTERSVERTIPVNDYPSDVAVGAGAVWVALGPLAQLVRINPEQNQAASPLDALGEDVVCGSTEASIAIGAGAIWFACGNPELGRVDIGASEGRAVGLEAELISGPSSVLSAFVDVAFGLEALWIVDRETDSIIEVDPSTIQKQRPITVGKEPTAIAVGGDSLWVTNFGDDTVTRVQIPGRGQTPTLTHIPVADGPVDVAFGEGAVWVASQLDRTVSRIDPESNDVEAEIEIGNEPQRLAAGEGSVWVTVRAPDEPAVDS
jgi:DNA-binding beta-propeller fold protein YncE/predicted Ser/Thr protein kinase